MKDFFSLTTDAESLQKQTEGALSIFRSTMNKLTGINERAQAQALVKQEEIAKAHKEVMQLKLLSEDNTKIINKIKDILH